MIGDRKERIRIVRRTRAQRTSGAYDLTDTTLAERWAAIQPVRATEGEQAGRSRGSATYMIELDATGLAPTSDDTILWLTKSDMQLNIKEVRLPPTRDLALVIIATSGDVVSG